MHLLSSGDNNIILNLIDIIDDKQVYVTFAECLMETTDKNFVSKVICSLNTILLENFEFKTKTLWTILAEEINKEVFETLFKTWVQCSLSALVLSIIGQNFELSYWIMLQMDEVPVSNNSLQLVKFIQIFESESQNSSFVMRIAPKSFGTVGKSVLGQDVDWTGETIAARKSELVA